MKLGLLGKMFEKLNPAQEAIIGDEGNTDSPSSNILTNQKAYNQIDIVNRGVNLIVDSAAEVRMDIGDSMDYFDSPTRIRQKKLAELLNFRPNAYQNADVFKRNIFMDLLIEGDAFIYFDGVHMFNLPACNVTITKDKKTFVKKYSYADKDFQPNEIIHIRENSSDTIYAGTARLDAAKKNIELLNSLIDFQKNFFDNSAIPGIILTTPNPLSERVKNRMVMSWMSKYNPKRGGKRPLILDGEFKVESLSKYNFKELEFAESIVTQETAILKALGVPPILMDSGNNANINPNLRMFYITNVMPLFNKLVQALELYFGYDIKAVTQDVLALRPELKELQSYLTGLTNAGIITVNEARTEIRYEKSKEAHADKLIIPANIAGSAVDPTQGGAPKKEPKDGDKE